MSISKAFKAETLRKIIDNLPDDNKDINAYRPVGLVSVINNEINTDKLYKRYERSEKYNRSDVNGNEIAIATKWNTFTINIPDDTLPVHTKLCLCTQDILYHFWIKSIKNNDLRLIGSCCIEKFMNIKGKSCELCGEAHNNKLSNYCNKCRVKCTVHDKYHDNNSNCKYKYEYYIMEFGKYKGIRISNVPESYINWMRSLSSKGIYIERALNIWMRGNQKRVAWILFF